MNRTLLFCVKIPFCDDAVLSITGHSNYRVFINGKLVLIGPARVGKGYYRVDEIPIAPYLTSEKNDLSVIVTGYNCSSFYVLNEPSFLCAEVISSERVLCYTGDQNWKVYGYDNRLQWVQRYTKQRTFVEVYDFCDRVGEPLSELDRFPLITERASAGRFIAREIDLPELHYEAVERVLGIGSAISVNDPINGKPEKFVENAGVSISGYPKEELEIRSTAVGDHIRLGELFDEQVRFPFDLQSEQYTLMKMRGNLTGLISLQIEAVRDTELYLTFDEILSDGKVDFRRLGCSNIVIYRLKGGRTYELLTAEPYNYQYLNLIVVKGSVQVSRVGMIETAFSRTAVVRDLNKEKADEVITRIYEAAVETFRQNTFDIYMDCPSRERAGWLCDSFFTARVEHLLTGKSRVEKNFLSNFLMADSFPALPKGVIPMCYPADHDNGQFIPNWMMWFVLELEEYLARTGDRSLVNDAKNMVYGALEYLRRFENSNGLLEKLESWVFVEWSRSNDLVQDINYPTNMLYYRFKKTIARLYGDALLDEAAEALKREIRLKSRLGLFFCDNSVYDESGVPKLSGECTETCQYYAFFCGVADFKTDEKLWRVLVNDFGPERKQSGKWKEIAFSNAFIGNYLRLDLLDRAEEYEKLESNIREFFDMMAEQTGTLWEHDSHWASCNHGFASHVLVWLDRLGYLNTEINLKI